MPLKSLFRPQSVIISHFELSLPPTISVKVHNTKPTYVDNIVRSSLMKLVEKLC
jgi:hypothetical protein